MRDCRNARVNESVDSCVCEETKRVPAYWFRDPGIQM